MRDIYTQMRTLINILIFIFLIASCGVGKHKVRSTGPYDIVTNNNGFGGGKEERQEKRENRKYERLLRKGKIDFDKDGIPDHKDIDPYLDSDSDGVLDYEDKCPTVFGVVDNNGCPEITMEIKEAPPKQLLVEFRYVLVSSWEDMLNKNPKFAKLDTYWPAYYEEVKSKFNPIRHNLQLVEQLWLGGCISNEVYEDYKVRVNKGEVFTLDLSECDMYEYGVPINGSSNGKVSYIPNVENMDIVDNTDDSNSSKGTIAYSVPKEMQVGNSYQIKLRITKEKGKEVNKTLVIGEREIPIADPNIESKVTIENIRVERTMTTELLSEDGAFTITPLNTDKQIIEDESYTEWGWIVTPLKSGKTYLKLIIKIKIEADGETSYKDIVVFDKDIEVKTNLKHGVKGWVSQYWEWLMSTIIIPLVIFFYKRREKKKEG